MKTAILLTTANRIGYLHRTLQSWQDVRGFFDTDVHAFVEPGRASRDIVLALEGLHHPKLTIHENPRVYGVLENPYQGFEHLFRTLDYHFVIRAEDDLCVSTDILEYFAWAAEKYRFDPDIVSVHGYTDLDGYHDDEVYRARDFNPLVWGTWYHWWVDLIGPTWDRDYSTYNGVPGNQAGWDWNLNTRVLPGKGLGSIFPTQSRVDNIGIFGTHSTPESFRTSPSYFHTRPATTYREVNAIHAVTSSV